MEHARQPLTAALLLTEALPLTEAQTGLWFAQRLAPLNPAFNTAHVLWLAGDLNIAAFMAAANQAVTEAESLSLRFAYSEGSPQQWRDTSATPLLEVVDLSDQYQTFAAAKAAAQAQMQADYLTPLDPTRDRLAKQQLFILSQHDGEQHFAWYMRVHHLVNDGYGIALLAERVHALYHGDHTSREFAPLEPVLAEDAAYQDSARRTKDAAYWQQALRELPPPASLAGESGMGSGYQCHRKTVALDSALMAELQQVAEREQLPWPDVLTAFTGEYCRRHTDSEGINEAIVGVPFMGRLGSKSARLPAMVMNVLPLALRDLSLHDEQTAQSKQVAQGEEAEQVRCLSYFLQYTARELTRGRRHGRYRGEQIRRDLGLMGGQRRLYGPLINVQPFYSPLLWPALTTQLDILSTGPVDDMTLGFRGDAKAALDLEIEASAALYSQADVNDHAARLPAFLRSAFAVYQANGQLQDIQLATAGEAKRYVTEVNATEHSVPSTSLVALYEAQMAATPEASALVFNGVRLTYSELEIRTRALALQLIEQGVSADSLVAVALPRSFELVIALVAIQRAGGAYLPLDAAQPDERLTRILNSAKPVCVLSQETARFRNLAQAVLAPQDWQANSTQSLAVAVAPNTAAYVIYTSGSTGEPKGVVIEHQAIVNRLLWMQDYFAIDAKEHILQKTPATFDVSVWEFFLPLISGAQLVIAPPDAHQDPRLIADLIREYDITTLHFVPSMLAAFLATPSISDLKPKRVIVSGEALSASLRDRFHQSLNAQLFNLYGPTEAAVDVSVWEASSADTSSSVPIGVPVWNTQLYVLDSQLRPLPPGVAGDLYLGGVQLARGYLGQPELTAATFIDHPFVKGERLYKSGDVARFRRDGAVEYLGRSDDQVKLRGLRIELGDINHALSQAPSIARAHVLLQRDVLRTVNGAEPKLVAYIEPTASAQTTQLEAQVLRAHLAGKLPEYMVPSVFVTVHDWPLSANGKLNRKALPEPNIAQSAGGELNSDTERALAQLFAEQLHIEQAIGSEDDFFALGGDSLSAVHLLLAIQARWHWDPGFGALFANPTVAGLAALIDAPQDQADDGLGAYVRLSEGDASLAPLFTIHPAGGIAWNYRELAQTLAPKRTVYGLQSPALQLSAQQLPTQQALNQPAMEESIDALGARYVATLTTLYPSGPVHLVGWSVGGIIAHAMAICLRQQGREVGVLALLDAYPAECWRAEPEPSPVAALRALLAIAGYDPERHLELDSREKIVAFLRQGDSTLGNLPEAALDGVVRAVTSTNLLVRGHYHGRFDGTLMHLRAALDHVSKPQLQSSLWNEYAANIEAIALPYLHAEMTSRDASARIAPLLAARMAQFEPAAINTHHTAQLQETSCS
ncbi:non-ribosomal peptide synthetase [Oceanisphaera avium]|uniref:Non-ribosomal peptide synthetase n=1 Tax=Oceanisphaera avium TaxID=1903694 RepID=A0A1Y0CWN4_9GAMM|nr:non-ribosomal peptide synthetase [Oceanisphaera avium]ART79669.1 non-ribosomal peptide synthetase [Oceanisphaera avium]